MLCNGVFCKKKICLDWLYMYVTTWKTIIYYLNFAIHKTVYKDEIFEIDLCDIKF